jgi:hypothetical protein
MIARGIQGSVGTVRGRIVQPRGEAIQSRGTGFRIVTEDGEPLEQRE